MKTVTKALIALFLLTFTLPNVLGAEVNFTIQSNHSFGANFNEVSWQGQRFNYSDSLYIYKVEQWITGINGGTPTQGIEIRLYAENSTGKPALGTILAMGHLPSASVVNAAYNNISFSVPYLITPDTPYWIIIRSNDTETNYYGAGGHENGTYPGGYRIFTGNDGSTYTDFTTHDMRMNIYLNDTSVAPNVIINLPVNASTFSNNATLNFTATDDNTISMNCWYSLDGQTEVNTGNITNATTYHTTLTNLYHGLHNVSATCQDQDSKNTTTVRWFTILHYQTRSIVINTTEYETVDTYPRITIEIADFVTNLNATLVWNGVRYEFPANLSSSGSQNVTFNTTIAIPLVASNTTNISSYWEYTLNNGSSIFVNNTANTTSVLWAYYVRSVSSNVTEALENQQINITARLEKLVSLNRATVTANTTFNGSTFVMTGGLVNTTTFLFSTIITAPNITGNSLVIGYNTTGFFDYVMARSQQINNSFTIYKPQIVQCGGISSTQTLNITIFDEDTPTTRIPASVDATFTFVSAGLTYNTSFAFENNNSYVLCIYPTSATFMTNATIQYYNTSTHPLRDYFLVDASLTNTTNYLALYLLTSSTSNVVSLITVKDSSLQPMAGVLVKAQRYYPSTNTYITVAMARTDSTGVGTTRLKGLDPFYKFIVEQGSALLQEFTPTKVTPDPITNEWQYELTVTQSGIGEYFTVFGNVAYDCTYNNVTTVLRCTVSDSTNLMTSSRLLTEVKRPLTWDTVCDTTSSSSATTHTCTLGTTANGTFRYTLTATFEESTIVLESANLFFGEIPIYAQSGVFVAFLVFITMCAIGIWNPYVSITLGLVGLMVTALLGIWIVSFVTFAGLVVAIAIIFYYRSGR